MQGQYNFQNDSSASNFFVAFIDTDGTIYIENSVVTEEQFLIKAREALNKSEKTSAILFVQSSIIQGIHLSAQLSKIGFRTVEVFYPTATNR